MSDRHLIKKKCKKPKHSTQSTTNPQSLSKSNSDSDNGDQAPTTPSPCPLLAKDSEWVDILQTTQPQTSRASIHHRSISEEEEVLQLVECEDDPEVKPLTILFPRLLEKDPDTLKRMMTKSMSTTEITRHLVDLGQKANFTYMKKANRLIPRDKKWLDSLAENSSNCSVDLVSLRSNMDYDADTEVTDEETTEKVVKKKKLVKLRPERSLDSLDNGGCVIDTVINKDKLKKKSKRNLSAAMSSDNQISGAPSTASQSISCKKNDKKTKKQTQKAHNSEENEASTTKQCKNQKSKEPKKKEKR